MQRIEPTPVTCPHLIEVLDGSINGQKVLEAAGATNVVELTPGFYSATLGTDVAADLNKGGNFRCSPKRQSRPI